MLRPSMWGSYLHKDSCTVPIQRRRKKGGRRKEEKKVAEIRRKRNFIFTSFIMSTKRDPLIVTGEGNPKEINSQTILDSI
jgi:hypothetical protein